MANCPKCNAHLKMTDWRQHCPHCGANIVVYDLQERLMQQADISEVQYYHFQKKIDRLKASFIGSKLAVARIITSVLPIGPIFLPLMNGKINEPLAPLEGNVSIIKLYNMMGEIDGEALRALRTTAEGKWLSIAVILFLASLLLTLVHFFLLTLACSPKGKIRNILIDVLILITSFGSVAALFLMPDGAMISAGPAFGAFLYLFAQIINVAVDIATLRQGIEVNHKQCYVGGIPIEEYFELVERGMPREEIRQEQYARLLAIQQEQEKKILEDEEKKAHSQNAEESGPKDGEVSADE